MKKKVLCIEFHNANGDVVSELSKCPAAPQDVMAALNFLDLGFDLVVSVVEGVFDEQGNFKVSLSQN